MCLGAIPPEKEERTAHKFGAVCSTACSVFYYYYDNLQNYPPFFPKLPNYPHHQGSICGIQDTHSCCKDDLSIAAWRKWWGVPAKRIGKIKINQILVPCAPWSDAMPSSATSDEVSNPKPNNTPSGYIIHGLIWLSESKSNILRPWSLTYQSKRISF